ncbi:hypothetical protein predicted by Glimmer/Critica (plasmid) [Sinorhizobium fredii HH103]|uniref:Uncharacterized protein n=1 Tax=Sinorhizobium fredii (strain HH103) TaxID=1117943 RepID=G9AHD7_SINF1|nr:hypothetical protein predicted by Glimmer/Critica [Sinorhizobium fredii HH103]
MQIASTGALLDAKGPIGLLPLKPMTGTPRLPKL